MPRTKGTRIGFFLAVMGNDPVDDDDLPQVQGSLDAAIEDGQDMAEDDGDEVTVYELVPRARIERLGVKVTKL